MDPDATAVAPSLPWATASSESVPAGRPARPAPTRNDAPGASPFAAVIGEGQPSRIDLDEDEEWDEPEASYTWLHYIVLVVVAFVLGLLVWNLLLDGPDEEGFGTEEATVAMSDERDAP